MGLHKRDRQLISRGSKDASSSGRLGRIAPTIASIMAQLNMNWPHGVVIVQRLG